MLNTPPTVKGFVAAFGANWFTKMSGPLTVPFTIAALFVPSKWLKALFAALAILSGVAASYAIWMVERKRANSLEAKLAPKLSILRRIHRQPWTDSRGSCVSYYVDVVNESEGETVEEIEVCLTAIDPPAIKWLPVPLHIKHDNKQPPDRTFSLNPLDKKQVDLVSMVQGAPTVDIVSTIGGTGVSIKPDRYLMTVTASGRNVRSASRTFDVWVDHEQYLQAEGQ